MFDLLSPEWWLVAYLTIGWLLSEGVRWAQRRAGVPLSGRLAFLMILLAWPLCTTMMIVDRVRKMR